MVEGNQDDQAGQEPVAEDAVTAPAAEVQGKKKGKKEKKKFDPLSDDPVKFKKIDFNNALTAEEKAANKAAKIAEAKAAKKGGKKAKKPAPEPTEAEPAVAEGAEPKEAPAPQKKGKAGKKAKNEAADEGEAGEEAAAPAEQKKGKKGKKGKKETVGEEAAPAGEGGEEVKGKKKGKKEATSAAEGGEGGEAKGKKKEKKEKAMEGAEAEGKKPKGKKGKKEKAESDATTDEAAEGKKGKKGKKGKAAAEGEEGEAADKKPGKKGKKGKGKGKKAEVAKLPLQMSVTAFLEHFASMQADDDEWTWESYSVSQESVKEEVKVKGKKGKGKGKKGKAEKGKGKKKDSTEASTTEGESEKKGKGKKGKKGKEKKEEEIPEPASEAVSAATDIMAEINKMKALAEAQAQAALGGDEEQASAAPSKKSKKSKKGKSEAGEPKPKKEKTEKGPKKKLSKKEKAKLAAKLTEEARIQAELDAKRAEEEERIRLIEERKAAIEKEKRETAEQLLRVEQLNNSLNIIRIVKTHNLKEALKDKDDDEWKQYLVCDGLPNPFVCGEMTTYLDAWQHFMETTTIDDAARRTTDVLKLLDMLTSFIDDPVGADQTQIDNWKWVHCLYREYQQKSLDSATYRLLRDIDANLHSINILTSDFQRKEENFALSLWVLIRMPTSKPNPWKPPPPQVAIDFPDMRLSIVLPISIDCYCMAVRAMYVKYDHLSDLCASYAKPPVPEEYDIDLNKATFEEWNSKLFYKYENYLMEKKNEPPPEGPTAPEEEEFVDRAAGIIPVVPYRKIEPTASTYLIAEEDALLLNIRQRLLTMVDNHVINLRKYITVGGTYFLDLYYQPPQPQDMVSMNMTITGLEMPEWLRKVPFSIEEPLGLQDEQLNDLVVVTLTLPEHVMWFDIPLVCQWDQNQLVWTTADVLDLKQIEETGGITFRIARFSCFSFAVNRFYNMPFRAWEMKPEQDRSVTFQLTAAILLIEFNIREKLICIVQFQNCPNKALQEIVGVYYKLPRLIRILQDGGVDVFPAFDAFCYVEDSCEKHWPMEKHLYYNMAQLSACFNFAWSHWNKVAGRRTAVLQMREFKPEKTSQAQLALLYVTPLNAQFSECSEDSEMFCEPAWVEGTVFYSDLNHLVKGSFGMATRSKVQATRPELVGAVADFLLMTRVLSLS